MRELLSSIALATQDGIVTGMSNHEDVHPLYETPSFGLRMEVPLNSTEKLSAEYMVGGYVAGDIQYSIRSWAAQLGLAGFNPECTELRLHGSTAIVETLVSDISNEQHPVLIDSLRSAVKNSIQAKIGRLVLLPNRARLGKVRMPLRDDVYYEFNHDQLDPNELMEIWQGKSGREAILAIRQNMGLIPEELGPGKYFVGAVDADPRQNYWVLEPVLMRGKDPVQVLHDQSCLYDPVRTTGERQVEIRNINGRSEPLQGIEIEASVYQTNLELIHCEQTEGV